MRLERMVGHFWSDAGKKIDEFLEALNALRRDMSSVLELEATLVLHDVKFVSSRTLKSIRELHKLTGVFYFDSVYFKFRSQYSSIRFQSKKRLWIFSTTI